MSIKPLICLAVCGCRATWAQPVIANLGVTNAASYAMLQAPGAGIAPGSIFVIFGTGLGPETLQLARGYPLQAELAGTSVRIGGSTAYMVYVSATQTAAIAPSSLAPGTYPLTVTSNNRTSEAKQIAVAKTNFGVFTRNAAGYGQAAAHKVTTGTGAVQTLGLATAVKPGESLVLYGTGLGAIAGAADDRPPGALPTAVSVDVVIAGRTVTPEYAGRSPNFAGLDQINFTVPALIEPDCYAVLGVRANGRLSNVVSAPVTRAGSNCPHALGLPEPALQRIDSGGTVRIAQALMERQSSPSGGSEGAGIGFAQIDANVLEDYSGHPADSPDTAMWEPGRCVARVEDLNKTISTRPRLSRAVFFDAGPSVLLSGPSFSTELMRTPGSSYGASLVSGTGTGSVLSPGTWTYSGTGGIDIGPFQISVELTGPLMWTNRQEVVDTKQPWRIDWTGGSGDPVRIVASASVQESSGVRLGTVACTAMASGGTITIPAQMLAVLPAGGRGGITITQAATKIGFRIPVTGGAALDGAQFRIVSQTSGSIQVQ